MELDASLSWLALPLTPGLASHLSARLLRKFGSADGVFRGSLAQLESCRLAVQVAQSIIKKEAFRRAAKELDGVRPQTLLQIYDPAVLLYARSDPQVLNLPNLSIAGTRRPNAAWNANAGGRLQLELFRRSGYAV